MIFKQLLFIILIIVYEKPIQSHTETATEIGKIEAIGKSKCLYQDTINITGSYILTNDSYFYNNQTLIPSNLVDTYDYEILYNGTKRSVLPHKRACICHLKPCITFCSNSITYSYNEFIKNNLYDLLEIFNISMTLTNQSVTTKHIVKDFEHIVLNEFCASKYPLSPEIDDDLYNWTLFENGTLWRHKDNVLMQRTEYCFEIHYEIYENETYPLINPMNCAKNRNDLEIMDEINYWIQVFSTLFCVLTICAYCLLPGLLNVSGKCFITYLSNLTLSFAILSYINLSRTTVDQLPCIIIGYLIQFLQLAHYTWLGIISYDTWKKFSDYDHDPSYYKYAKLGYPLPFIITLISWFAQRMTIDDEWKPGISEIRCGLDVTKWIAAIYLYGYCLIILICCFVFFILTSKIIEDDNRKSKGIRLPEREGNFRNYIIYLRLFFIMGLSWFLEVLSFVLQVTNHPKESSAIDCIISLQGLFIFINFIARKDVRKLLRTSFRSKRMKKNKSNCCIQLLKRHSNVT